MIRIQVGNAQSRLKIDKRRLRAAVRGVLARAGIGQACVSVAVVDDPTIRDLHRRFLDCDRATDVLSFTLESGPGGLEGEIVVSADTAAVQAERFGWSPQSELLLYVVHGALHLTGHDDATPAQRAAMQAHEQVHLARWGLEVPYE